MSRKSFAWLATIGLVTGVAIAAAAIYRKQRSEQLWTSDDHPYRNDPVDLYIEESFPASDAPGYSAIAKSNGKR